jgi:DNA-binding transcriptional ArsR family regulator
MSIDGFKPRLFDAFAQIGKALGNGRRLELLEALAQGERPVEKLAAAAGLSVANASQHLLHLRRAGLLEARRDGQHIFYRLADPEVFALLSALQRLGQRRVAEVDRLVDTYLRRRDAMEPVTARDLLRRVRAGEVTVIDVRPPDEYAAGHIAGAVNLPLAELEKRLAQLPKGREVIAYCRGPWCALAFTAVERLRARDRRARRLEFGFPEWRQARLPVATAAADRA